ncbi:hypothetical protein [Brevundimonas phoenicis]|uniref:hypothetical protein n=1 Tax=unclassified Brevundimonas TaxID=2622653 RepID=UPI0039A3F1FD
MTVYVPELEIPTRDLKVRLLRAHARVHQTWAAVLRDGDNPRNTPQGEQDIARAELEEVEAEILLAQAAALEGGAA